MQRLALLTYHYVPDILERRGPHRDEHLALLAEHGLVIGGAVGDPPYGALLAFPDGARAAAFRDADPYGAAGLVTESRIEPWTVMTGTPG